MTARAKAFVIGLVVAVSTPVGRLFLLVAVVLGICGITAAVAIQHRHDVATKAATEQITDRLKQAGPGHELDAL